MLTERPFGSHPRRVVSVSYVRVMHFHSDALRTSRAQILPDLVPSKGKQEASSVVNADPRISGVTLSGDTWKSKYAGSG
jgi:hypothetical protein